MAQGSRLPTLRVTPEAIASKVLVVGDPTRAEAAAALLDQADRVGSNREYVTYTGRREGEPLSICSHGVGSAGAGICFEELARADTEIIIRAGTCGAVQNDIADGDLVIASGAVRDEGLTPRLVPAGYPAVAHHEIVATLETVVASRGAVPRTGLILSTDLFYPSAALGIDWTHWKKSAIQAVEMELAPLFVISSLHGIKAGGILAVDGNPTKAAEDMSDYDPYRSVVEEAISKMLDIGLEALVRTQIDS
jgi:uridine phosphorylase